MKNEFLTFTKFISVYTIVFILNFTIPFILPPKIVGPYLFWTALSISTIVYSILIVRRQ